MNFDTLINIDKHTFFSYVLVVLGTTLFLKAIWLWYKSRISENWNQTTGTVIKSELDRSEVGTENTVQYKPTVEYEYEVEHKLYRSKRLYFGSTISSSFKKRKSVRLIQKYAAGTEVRVYYNQSNPKEAVLESGIHSEVIVLFLSGILFSVTGYLVSLHPYFLK